MDDLERIAEDPYHPQHDRAVELLRKSFGGLLGGVRKGDVEGHPFHGNQHTGGSGKTTDEHADHILRTVTHGWGKEGTDEHDGFQHGVKQAAEMMRNAKTPAEGREAIKDKSNSIGGATWFGVGQASGLSDAAAASARLDATGPGNKGLDADLTKGDVSGHPFHGNQYSSMGSGPSKEQDERRAARIAANNAARQTPEFAERAQRMERDREAERSQAAMSAKLESNLRNIRENAQNVSERQLNGLRSQVEAGLRDAKADGHDPDAVAHEIVHAVASTVANTPMGLAAGHELLRTELGYSTSEVRSFYRGIYG